jgi:hypothetical protein
MEKETNDTNDLELQVALLNRKYTKLIRMYIMGFTLLAIIGSTLIIHAILNTISYAQAKDRRIVEAEEFVLRGPNNIVLATLSAAKYGPYFNFYDMQGETCAQFWLDKFGPKFSLDKDKHPFVSLSAHEQGGCLQLNTRSWPSVYLHADQKGAGLDLYGPKTTWVTLEANQNYERLEFTVKDGCSSVFNVGTNYYEHFLFDEHHNKRMSLAYRSPDTMKDKKAKRSLITLYDEKENILWSAP